MNDIDIHTVLLGLTDDELINLINQCVDLICDRLL